MGDYFSTGTAHSQKRVTVKGPIDEPEKVCINISNLDGLVMARLSDAPFGQLSLRNFIWFIPELIDDKEGKGFVPI